jgi:hypothetical protein
MAKKKETKLASARKAEVETPVVETPVVETPPVVERPKKVKVKSNNPEDNWEIKDRTYWLKRGKKPLSFMIRSSNIYYFDEEKGYERELKYTSNQKTCFVDEMVGEQRLEHVIFRNGALIVPRNKTILQKFLSLYHPHRDNLYYEWKPVAHAASQLDWLEFEAESLIAAKNLDIELAEAVMRVENGSRVSEMSSKELRRDLMIFAKNNPKLFLELVSDENIQLRNFGIKATEMGILKLSQDQRTFMWGSTDRKLMNIPFDEHPYSALAAWFKTDEGMEIYSQIEKRMK